MKTELLESEDIVHLQQLDLDELSADPQEVDISPPELPQENGVLWKGHYITPDPVFEDIEFLAKGADSKTIHKVQDSVERLAKAKSEGVSEKRRLPLLNDIEVLSENTKSKQPTVCQNIWLWKSASKVAKFVRKHKAAIIASIAIAVVGVIAAVIGGAAAAIGRALDGADDKKNPDSHSENNPSDQPTPSPSRTFITSGIMDPHCRIGGINGINSSYEEALGHATYLSNFTQNRSVEWVYNHSNGIRKDLAEVGTNYLGHSPNTGKLLKENWVAFHEQNKDHPHAKYLQFCHSKGAIDVKNELAQLPAEIRNRVVVIAIAPVAVVPSDLCYASYNYASKKDLVPYSELVLASALDSDESGDVSLLNMAIEHRKELIILEPHPDATGIDHSFESPTFKDRIRYHINDYLKTSGEYESNNPDV